MGGRLKELEKMDYKIFAILNNFIIFVWITGSYKHDNKPSGIDTPGKSFTRSENIQGQENKVIVVS